MNDNVFYVSKGFTIDDSDFSVVISAREHRGSHVDDCTIRYFFGRRCSPVMLDLLRQEGFYTNDLYKALAGKFGKKPDDAAFNDFLCRNHIWFRRSISVGCDDGSPACLSWEDVYGPYDEE